MRVKNTFTVEVVNSLGFPSRITKKAHRARLYKKLDYKGMKAYLKNEDVADKFYTFCGVVFMRHQARKEKQLMEERKQKKFESLNGCIYMCHRSLLDSLDSSEGGHHLTDCLRGARSWIQGG